MEENIELNKIEESKDLTQPEQEIKQKEVEGDPIAPKSAGTPTGNIIQFRKGTKAQYSSSSNIDTNTISVVSNADGTSTGTFSEIYLGDDMIGCGHNFVNYTSSSNPGRAGLVPAPGSGDTGKFLSVDGWSSLPAGEGISKAITVTGASNVVAGWRKLCTMKRGSYLVFMDGLYTSGIPALVIFSITIRGDYAALKQISGYPSSGSVKTPKVRLVNKTESGTAYTSTNWELDYYHNAVTASTGDFTFYICGIGYGAPNYINTDITVLVDPQNPDADPASGVRYYELTFRQMYDQPTVLTNLASETAGSMNGGNIQPGVTGTLPVAHGGTGETTASGIIQNLIQGALTDATGDVTDSTELITTYQSGYSSSHKDLYRRSATKLWNYISSKLGSVFGLTSSTDSSDNPITLARTAPAGTNTTQIATTAFVQNAISGLATDSNVVHLTGPETITGEKTFEGAEVLLKNSGTGSNINSGLQLIGNQRQVGSNPAMYSYLPKIKFISGIDDTHTYRGDNFNIWYGTNRWISEDRGESTLYFTYDEVGGSSYNILTLTKDVRTVSSVLTKKYTATFGSSTNYGDVTVESPKFKIRTTDTLSGYEYIKADGTGYGGLFGAASSTDPGSAGLVPAPAAGDQVKFLKGDGTWASVSTSDVSVDQVGINTSTDRYPLILKKGNSTTDENGCVNFSKLGSSLPVLSASPNGKIYAAGVTIVNASTGAVPTYSNNEYVKADGSGHGGNFTGSDVHNEQDGAPGLVPAPGWKEYDYYLKADGTWHDIITDISGMIDHKVTMVATATETTKYPLLFKYTGGTSYTSNEQNYVRFSKVAGSSASILSATPAGDLYSKSLTATGDIEGANFKVTGTTSANPSYIKADGTGAGSVYTWDSTAGTGSAGLVPDKGALGEGESIGSFYLCADGSWSQPPTAPVGEDVKVRQTATGSNDTTRYAILFRYASGITSDSGGEARFSNAGTAQLPTLSATGSGGLYAGSLNIKGNASTPTNELVLESYNASSGSTPKLRFQRGTNADANIDWTISNDSDLMFKSETTTTKSVLTLRDRDDNHNAQFGSGISVIVTGDAATPTNELILKNYQNGNQTPAIRFQRKDAHDAYIDWLIRDSSTGTLTISSEIKENNVETVTNVIKLANYGSSKYAMFGTDIKVISQNSFYLGTGTNDTPLCEWESFSS